MDATYVGLNVSPAIEHSTEKRRPGAATSPTVHRNRERERERATLSYRQRDTPYGEIFVERETKHPQLRRQRETWVEKETDRDRRLAFHSIIPDEMEPHKKKQIVTVRHVCCC